MARRWSTVCGPEGGCSGLLETRPIQCLQSRSVGAEQCQVEPWPRDQSNIGRIFLAPAQLKQVAGLLDRDANTR
jgi:hypothetical protein